MSSTLDHHTPHPPERASPSSLKSHVAPSRQMSSLSVTTLTTTSHSHHPTQPLLRNVELQEALARQPLNPDASERIYWQMDYDRRMRRLRLLRRFLLLIMGSWASYTTVRYFIAYGIYADHTRQWVALPLAISSLLSIFVAAFLALSRVFLYYLTDDRPHLRSPGKPLRHALHLLASFLLFAPAVVNLALVFVWRNTESGLSLRGRCHWDLDVVWAGVGGQCTTNSPAWGVWLTATIFRFALTAAVLIAYHVTSRTYRASPWLIRYRAEDVQRSDNIGITQIAQSDVPSRPSPVLHPFSQRGGGSSSAPQRSLSSSRMEVIPEFSATRDQTRQHHEQESAESGTSPTMSLRRTKSSRDMRTGESSSRHAALLSNVEERELEGFADRFRALVDRVSHELEESRNLESEAEPLTPPLHHVLDTHMPYMTIDEFGRAVPSEESIAILGGVIKRMPTIESVGSRELSSLRSNTLVSGGIRSPSRATSSTASSRPPTRATMVSFNDAASASLASASQPSSRSNSIHRPRMPSELGELVRDTIRARGQSRPLPPPSAVSASARPGSGNSVGSGNGGEPAGGAAQRSRSSSLGPGEALAPVTEHGELGRVDAPPRMPRRLGDAPEQLLAGVVGTSEMGELVRTEWAQSWASSSPSVSSTAYFSTATGSTGGGSGSGDTGSRSNGMSRREQDEMIMKNR
ncbi:hypothetical protein BJV78DRAFT_366472 [Lactifluus subvellereus]|nr:hypothetical protein BJV78DRAFT_366472 [Lactifluus subvellereus]